ncbi:DNA (cytosine-5-)-methyltransferase, partial [Oligella urethralis]|uniref:DNA (cytosine-5-)-methyltransferase n=1 Tax=Oligella urethralis TaxID=90245 RepID=UPI001E57ACCA
RLGFQQHGNIETVFSSEWDKFAQRTYFANFGEIPDGDITTIHEKTIPAHDILVAGFPCQAFSQAGLKKGFDDTRGTLFFDIARILNEKRPKMFLLENVKNLLSHNKGKTFQTIHNTLENLDYLVFYHVLRARDFGVPQNRERIYIVGFDKKHYGADLNFNFPSPTHETTSVGDILESDVDDKYTISAALWSGHQRRKAEHEKKGNGFGYSLFDEHSPYTNTISARYYKDGSEILIAQKNKNPRKLHQEKLLVSKVFPKNSEFPLAIRKLTANSATRSPCP